ncbi:MAG: M15 family metallopeptidase [Methanobrevibacter sp.]|nr:M15 family metallopeptidase [Methanobrevibacter sp.]
MQRWTSCLTEESTPECKPAIDNTREDEELMIHKKLTDLEYSVQGKFHDAYSKMNASELLKNMGVESIAINETLRDLTTQMAYFVRGRMDPKYVKMFYKAAGLYEIGEAEAKTIITNTLESNHMSGRAADFVPVKDGKLWWNAPDDVWRVMGEIGESCGLKWGGRWKELKDTPHFEA